MLRINSNHVLILYFIKYSISGRYIIYTFSITQPCHAKNINTNKFSQVSRIYYEKFTSNKNTETYFMHMS